MLGEYQFVTYLLYLDDICIFPQMFILWWTELSFCYMGLNILIPRLSLNMSFLDPSVFYLGHVVLAEGTSTSPEKIKKIKNWPVLKSSKQV